MLGETLKYNIGHANVEEMKMQDIQAAEYQCTVCSYVYDPKLGDPDGYVKPGTPFVEIPNDWVCPICGAAKDQFKVKYREKFEW
jgi:rubredoxin